MSYRHRWRVLVVLPLLAACQSEPTGRGPYGITVFPSERGVIVSDGCGPIDPTQPAVNPGVVAEFRLFAGDTSIDRRTVPVVGWVEERWTDLAPGREHRVERWAIVDGRERLVARSRFIPGPAPFVTTLRDAVMAPDVSPDGSLIAVAEAPPSLRLQLIDSTGALADLGNAWRPVWSHDSRQLVFSSVDGTDTRIDAIEVGSGARVAVARLSGTHAEVFGASASEVDLVAWDAPRTWIRIPMPGGEPIVVGRFDDLTDEPTWWGQPRPAYSPDGTQVAYGAKDGSIVLLDAATGAVLQRVRNQDRVELRSSVAWHPDGTRLAVAVARGLFCESSFASVWTVDLATGAWRQHTGWLEQAHGDATAGLDWMPDGRRVAFSGGEGDGLHVVPVD